MKRNLVCILMFFTCGVSAQQYPYPMETVSIEGDCYTQSRWASIGGVSVLLGDSTFSYPHSASSLFSAAITKEDAKIAPSPFKGGFLYIERGNQKFSAEFRPWTSQFNTKRDTIPLEIANPIEGTHRLRIKFIDVHHATYAKLWDRYQNVITQSQTLDSLEFLFAIDAKDSATYMHRFMLILADKSAQLESFHDGLAGNLSFMKGTAWKVATGWQTEYGDSSYIYEEEYPNVGPPLQVFSDYINSGDASRPKDPTNSSTLISVLRNDIALMLERRTSFLQRKEACDTIFLYTTNVANHTTYKMDFYPNIQKHGIHALRMYDEYLQTYTDIPLDDTSSYQFTIDASLASQNPKRFYIVVSKYVEFVAPEIVNVTADRTGEMTRLSWHVLHGKGVQGVHVEELRGDKYYSIGATALSSIDLTLSREAHDLRLSTIGDSVSYVLHLEPLYSGLRVYPNPVQAGSMLLLDLPHESSSTRIELYSLSGQRVLVSDNTKKLVIPGVIPQGLYVLRIGSKYTQKIQITR